MCNREFRLMRILRSLLCAKSNNKTTIRNYTEEKTHN